MNIVNWIHWSQHLSQKLRGIISGCVRGRGGVDCNFVISFIFLLFLVFCSGGGVGGEFAISL